MESLCLLKAMSTFPLSRPGGAILQTAMPFTVDHFLMDTSPKQNGPILKRRLSLEEMDPKLDSLTPSKQRKRKEDNDPLKINSSGAEHSKMNIPFDFISTNTSFGHYPDRIAHRSTKPLVMKSECPNSPDYDRCSDMPRLVLPSPTRESATVLFPASSRDATPESAATVRSLSAPSLVGAHETHHETRNDTRHEVHEVTNMSKASINQHGEGECELKRILQNDSQDHSTDADGQTTRCRSLPCDMTSSDTGDHNKLLSSFLAEKNMLPSITQQQQQQEQQQQQQNIGCSPQHSFDENNDTVGQCDISSCDDASNDNDAENKVGAGDTLENDDCDSSPPTPSSCYVDIEADTPPSSPLNLTTTGGDAPGHWDRQKHSTSANPPSLSPSGKTSSPAKDTILRVSQENRDFDRSTHPKDKPASPEKRTEKSIKFSIDAILRPDFGVINSSNNQTELPSRRIPLRSQTTPTSSRNSIRSSHSAFTAVDLSTRSRSDSLSSPSCSSSSPSPPLLSSSSSPSPRQKADFHPSTLYEKSFPGQEHFQFPTRFFPDPSRDLKHLFAGTFPFVQPFPGHGLAKMPLVYTSQISPYYKMNVEKELLKQQPIPEIMKSSKSNLPFPSNVSKLFERSLYPFINETIQRPPEPQTKVSRDNQAPPPSKNHQDVTSHVARHQKTSNVSRDVTPGTKAAVAANNQDVSARTAQSKNVNQFNIASPAKDGSHPNKTDALKQEKPSPPQSKGGEPSDKADNQLWPAWVFCTRYSDRPSSGPRSRKPKRNKPQDEKRPRTAFTNDQLQRLKREFEDCRYLTETRRKSLADELGLTESQIKIWFQNKRAKIKKSVGVRNPLAMRLMEQGLYNHSTVKPGEEGYEDADDD